MKIFMFIVFVVIASNLWGIEPMSEVDEDAEIQKYLDEKLDLKTMKFEELWKKHHTFSSNNPEDYEEYLEEVIEGLREQQLLDYEKAIELSLYYLGFDENVLHSLKLDYEKKNSSYSVDGYDFPDYFLIHSRTEIRDRHKAIHWLQNAKLLLNDANYCISGIHFFTLLMTYQLNGLIEIAGCKYLFDNIKSYQRVKLLGIDLYKKSLSNQIKRLKNQKEPSAIFHKYELKYAEAKLASYEKRGAEGKYIEGDYEEDSRYIVAYVYYKGLGVEKDLEEAKEHMHLMPANTWKLFWAGWSAPKDKEFAIYFLRFQNTPYAKAQLKKIESGCYGELD